MNIKILCLVCGLLLAQGLGVHAATYYVSSSGSDSAAGTQTAPWAHCPGMQGWNGSKTLAAGDTVYFNNASSWTYSDNTTGDNVITTVGGVTYDGESWGTGSKAAITLTGGDGVSVFGINTDDATYQTVVKGFNMMVNNYGSGVSINWPYTNNDMTGAMKVIQDNTIASDNGENGNRYAISVQPYGYHTVSNVQILNNKIPYWSHDALAVYAGNDNEGVVTNVLVRGNEVAGDASRPANYHNYGMSLKNNIQNITIEYNYIHDRSEPGILIATCDCGDWQSCDTNLASHGPQNLIIRNNILKNNGYYDGEPGIILDGKSTTDVTIDIYGNIITGSYNCGIQTAQDHIWGNWYVKIYNNTLYNDKWGEICTSSASAVFKTFEVKNNILSVASGGIPLDDEKNAITAHSNNIIYSPDSGATLVMKGSTGYTSSNLSSYESTAYSTTPNFKNTSNLPSGFSGTYGTNMVPNADGLSVASGNAIDHGTALASTYNGAINLSGTNGGLTRPQGSGWDIGAYELASGTCTPTTCSALGYTCGSASDGCGNTLNCGTCSSGTCTSNKCVCAAKTCSSLGYTCGTATDGCGGTLNCGTCTYGSCTSNKCVCTSTTCSALGYNCGTTSDGCGNTLNCGTCTYGTCTANKCVCTAKTCSGLGYTCGSASDGCGGTLNCGTCSTGTCSANQCVTGSTPIAFVSPTPANGATLTTSSVTVKTAVSEPNLDTFKFNWNGTAYNVYDSSLVFAANMNNVSAIGDTSTTVIDTSNYSNNATCSSSACPTFTSSGKFNGAYHFNGSNYLEITRNSSLEPKKTLTLAAWVKLDAATPSAEEWVISRKQWSSDTFGYALGLTSTGGILFGAASKEIYSPLYSDWNSYHYIAATYSSGAVTIYRDGVKVGSGTVPTSLTYGTAQDVFIGSAKATTYPFKGAIDEVRIYNRALSAAEIAATYQSEFGQIDAQTWNFTDTIGGLAASKSYACAASEINSSGTTYSTETRSFTTASSLTADAGAGNVVLAASNAVPAATTTGVQSQIQFIRQRIQELMASIQANIVMPFAK